MKKHLLMLFAAVMAATMSLEARDVLIDEGFENGIDENVWTQEFVSGSMPWAVEDVADGLSWPSTVKQGTKRAYLRNSTGETQGYKTRLVSKVMDLRPEKVYLPELSFWYANPKWGADRDTLRVLYRTSERSAWRVLEEYSDASSDWKRVKLDLPAVGQTYQIAFEGSDNLGRGIVLDSIKLQSSPECTVPKNLKAVNKGAGRVTLSWIASFDADYFEVIISKDTIDPDVLEAANPESIVYHDSIDGLSTSKDLKLESGEFYLAYVRSICEEENSAWSSDAEGPFGFVVHVAKQVPMFEDFNSLAGTADPTRDPDWTWRGNTGNPNPYVNTKTTSAVARGYYSPDATPAVIFSGGTTLQPSTFIPADRYVYLATPAIADTLNENFALNQCQVHFWSTVYTSTGRKYGSSLIVGVMENPNNIMTFVPVDTVTVWNYKSFVENIVDLSSYDGKGSYVAFVSDFDRDNLFYIDNVTIEYKKAINKVTKISVNPRDTFATISWEGNASSYNVLITNAEVDPANPSADAVVDQAMNVTDNSYLCESLEADHSWNRPYYVYVQAEGQEWSYRYPFVTIASRRAIPYSYDFEAQHTNIYTISSDPTSQYVTGLGVFGNCGTYPGLVTNSKNSYAGSGYLFLNMRGGADVWVTLPMVEDLDSTQVKFYLSGSETYDQAHATVGVMSNPMDINTFIPVADYELNTTGYTRCYANFENYKGPDGVIAIVWGDVRNMSVNTINYIDELVVEKLSDCVPPTSLELAIEPDSVTVRWDSISSNEWEFFISRVAIKESDRIHKTMAEIAAMPSVVVAELLHWNDPNTNPEFGFGNLIPHSNYYIYTRATCDLDWWTEVAFATPCRDELFPYKETFESYSIGATTAGCWQLADYMGVDYPQIYQAGTSTASNKTLNLNSSGTTHRSIAILPTVEGNLSDMLLSFEARTQAGTAASRGMLIIGTMGDIRDQSSFVPFDTVYVSGSSFAKSRFTLSDYYLEHGNIAITSGLGTLQMNSDVLLDNVELRDPNCIEAYDFKQTNLAPHSIDVNWKGISDNDAWQVKLLKNQVALAAVKNGTYNHAYDVLRDSILSGKNLQIGGLDAMRDYYLYVRVMCGDSAWVMATVHTTCELLDPSKSNKETFDTYSSGAGSVPPCWTVGTMDPEATSTYIPYIYSSSTYASSGSNTLRIYSSSSYGPAWAATREIQCDSMTTVMVSFTAYISSSYWGIFGVMTDPEDLSTFVPIDSIHGNGQSTSYSYDLADYAALIPSSARYFAWRGRYNNSDYIYLDDVSVISTACPLTKPSISDLSTSSVRVSSGLRTNDEWILMVTNRAISDENLAKDNYVVPAAYLVSRDTINRRSFEVTGLRGQTKYYVYTATLCDSTMSQWRSLTFTTLCEARNPETMGTITFDEADGYTTGSSGEMPCWTTGSKSQSATASYIPYVEATASNMHNGNNYLKIYDYVSSSSTYVGAYAIMPALDVDSISKYQVNFWGRSNSSTSYNNQIIIGVVADPSDLNTFVAIDTVNLSRNAWDPYSVGFETYQGDYMGNMGTNIMFLSDFGTTNYAYISEISVELIPRCRPISSFTVESVGEDEAVVSWKGYQNLYRMMVADKALKDSEKPTYRYLIDTIVDHSENIHLTDLKPTTSYYVYAQGLCEDGDSTTISIVYASFKTECPTVNGVPTPFYDDFDSYNTGHASPGCWQFRSSNSSTYPQIQNVSSSGTKAVELYTTSTNNSWVVMPVVDGDLQDMSLSFDARAWSSNFTGTLYVGTMADPEDPTTFSLIASFPQTDASAFRHYTVNLGEYELMSNYLVFTSGFYASMSMNASSDVYLDNVGLELLTTCNAPKLKSLGTSFNTAIIHLTPSKQEDSLWQYVLIPDSIYQTIGDISQYLDTTEKKQVDNTNIGLTALESATSYYIYARTLCSEEETSLWTRNPLKITTQYYFETGYTFGFEKSELWEQSKYSESDNYYLHPALIAGNTDSTVQSYMYYPHSRENTDETLYARTGTGAMLLHADGDIHGGYVIFPSLGEPLARSFEFKVRPGFIAVDTKLAKSSFKGQFEIGTIEKGTSFETYESLATVRLDQLSAKTKATGKNNQLYVNYSLDLDSATVADRQLVLYLPKQTSDTANILFDDVVLGATKGFSLVSLKHIVATGSSAMIEWANVGGPWNLTIKDAAGQTVQQFSNLTATSQLVENLTPRTDYSVLLEAAGLPASAKGYVTSDKMSFRTLCMALEPGTYGSDFLWNFDNWFDYEENDVLGGDANDSLYFKPSCFRVGLTYDNPVNGYQWLIQRKGYEPSGAMTGYNASRHHEVGRDDSNALRIHTTAENFNSYLVLPELHCDLDTMMLEFYARCFVNYDQTYGTTSNRGKIVDATYLGSAYSQSIVVGTLTDQSDFSTLQIIDTLTYSHTHLTANDNVSSDPDGLNYWELMQLPLDNAAGKYLVLFQPAAGLMYIDDMSVKPVGNTLFKPTNPRVVETTATTATLAWNVRQPDFSSVVVLINVFGEEIFRDTIIGTQYQMQNLQPAMVYEWYVYQTNGTHDSPVTKNIRFYTECVTVNSDYSCGFEDAEGWKFIDGQTAYTQTLCWTYGDAIQNEWVSATFDPYNQPNTKNFKYSYSGENAVVMRASYNQRGASYQPYIATPAMDMTTFDTLQVKFWIRPAYVNAVNDSVLQSYTGTSYSKSIIVGTMTDPTNAATFVALDTVTYDGTLSIADKAVEANNYLFQQMKVELAGAVGPYVAFMTSFGQKGSSAQKTGDYLWLDEISFEHRQECKDPTNLTALEIGTYHAVLNWNGIDSAGSYVLQVSTDPFFTDEDAFVFNDEVKTNTVTIEHLEPLTEYVWRVQALCGERWGESSFSQKATFKTSRSPYYLEEFTVAVNANEWLMSKTHADAVVDGTGVIARGLDNWSFIRTTNNNGLEGPHYVASGYSNDYHWFVTPNFYLPKDDSVHFSMDLALTACNTAHTATGNAVTENDMKDDYYFMIIVSDDGGQTWKSENILAKWQNTNPKGMQLRDIPDTGMRVRYSLAQYAGKNIRIGLYREAKTTSTTGIAIHVDNVRLAYYDKDVLYTAGCQYEDITVGDIHLSGDDTEPGIHAYPSPVYASDEEAKKGKRDSVHQLEIEIFPALEFAISDTICEGETYTDYDFMPKSQTGVYHRKLQTVVHGCDSIVTLYLEVKPRRYAEDTEVAICKGETFEWNDKTYHRAGIYHDTVVSSIGCDSIMTLVISYVTDSGTDTIYRQDSISTDELPFTYEDPYFDYAPGQAPIYYPEGTPQGVYVDTVRIQGVGAACTATLIHTLTLYDREEAIDNVDGANGGAHKVIYHDRMYIILNDEWYTIEGQKVRDPRD